MKRRLAIALAALAILVLGVEVGVRSALDSPAPTLRLEDHRGHFLGEVRGDDDRLGFWPVDLAEADRVAQATRVVEDKRFRSHPGVDPVAVVRALRDNHSAGRRISGASTLAMQVARMQRPGPRTWPRKGVEALTAVALTGRHGRDAVLAQYLRLAPYGNNIHGIGYAARRYFDKPVADLSWAETAFLCALPQSPSRTNPYSARGRARARDRARDILDLLADEGLLSTADLARAHTELTQLHIPDRPERPPAALHPVLALEDQLRGQSIGPTVQTTLDLALQEQVQNTLAEAVAKWDSRGAGQAAAVVIDLDGFEVRAAVGSTDWFGAPGGAIDFTRARRTPGSTLKPFLYAAALDQGLITPTTVVRDDAHTVDGIGNADGRFLGPILPRQALANSRNVPAVQLAGALGLDETWALLGDLGLHGGRVGADHYGSTLAIGGMPTSPLALASAYTALADDGLQHELVWVQGQDPAPPRRVFSQDSARHVTAWLSDPMARLPTFPRMGHTEYPFPVAVKTGTSGDWRDAWTVAFSRRYLVVVWVGHPDWTPMQGLSGYRAGSVLARRILLPLHDERHGFQDDAFAAPMGQAVAVCPLTGKRAGPGCSTTLEVLPHSHGDTCSGHAAGAVPPSLQIVSPQTGAEVMADPDDPGGSLLLRVAAQGVDQVVWWVDGQPFAIADRAPFTTRWPLQQGEHRFEARTPFGDIRSAPVRIAAR